MKTVTAQDREAKAFNRLNKGKKAQPAAKVETAVTEKAGTGKSTSKGKLGELLGHSVVSVIRAMGKAGWTVEECQLALQHAKIEAKPHTIAVGLRRGRNNDKTRRIAPLSAKQLETLKVKTPAAKGAK